MTFNRVVLLCAGYLLGRADGYRAGAGVRAAVRELERVLNAAAGRR